MKLHNYDIILTNYPFSDLSTSKIRPALVLRTLEGKNNILCQITTKRHSLSRYEIRLRKQDCTGEIRFDSFIYVDSIVALRDSLIIKKIGSIKSEIVCREIEEKLGKIF